MELSVEFHGIEGDRGSCLCVGFLIDIFDQGSNLVEENVGFWCPRKVPLEHSRSEE
jgi:hypothetical protein